MALIRIDIPEPRMGGKTVCIEDHGTFILEKGPATLRTIAITHAGSGQVTVFDGVPDSGGFFPDEGMSPDHPDFYSRNGRAVARFNPTVMGSWMLDGGCYHGLSFRSEGGTPGAAPIATVVWVKFKTRQPPTGDPNRVPS